MDWLRLFSVAFVFTLLVVFLVFMVVLPIRPDVPAFVDVPTARYGTRSPELESDLTISIRSDGSTYLGIDAVPRATLEERLSGRAEKHALRIRADRSVAFQAVRRVVRVAREAGFRRVTFSVRPDETSIEDGFSLVSAPPDRNPWPAILIAAVCFSAALVIRFVRRSPSAKPGCAGWLLFAIAALALLFLWEMYFPSCPPGMWC